MAKNALIILFLLIITTPAVIDSLDLNIDNKENRRLAQKPSFDLKNSSQATSHVKKINGLYIDVITYKNSFDTYYSDNFRLKSILFNPYRSIKTNAFHVDPLPKKVIEGSEGWYFLGNSFKDVISSSKGITNFNKNELEEISQNLSNKQVWLDSLNIKFYIAIAPNKHNVYNEKLPIIMGNKPTKLDQLKNLYTQTKVNVIDLSEGIISVDEQTYHKKDTHWNDLGAYLGTVTLIEHLQKEFPALSITPLDSYTKSTKNSYDNWLSRSLHTKSSEDEIILTHNNPQAKVVKNELDVPINYFRDSKTYEIRYKSKANDIKVLIIRDSFCISQKQFLAEAFGETILLWDNKFDKEVILKEKPDIVIREIVERNVDVLKTKI